MGKGKQKSIIFETKKQMKNQKDNICKNILQLNWTASKINNNVSINTMDGMILFRDAHISMMIGRHKHIHKFCTGSVNNSCVIRVRSFVEAIHTFKENILSTYVSVLSR